MIDNCASTSITNCLNDFVQPPQTSGKCIQGIGGLTTTLKIGTVAWKIEDDLGFTHTITLPKTYYAPNMPCQLLYPQHWSQMAQDNKLLNRGTWCATYDDCLELWWNQCHHKCTIQLHPTTNVAVVRSTPGCLHYAKSHINIKRHHKQVAFPSTIDIMGTQDTDHQDLQDQETTHNNVLQDEENTLFDPIKVNFEPEYPEQEIHEGLQGIELEQGLLP